MGLKLITYTKNIIVNLAVVLALAVSLLGCESSEQEQAALSVVNEGVALIESQSVSKALRLTSDDFLAQPGRLGKTAVSHRLFSLFRTHGEIEIHHPHPDVEILESGEAALVTMPFVVAKRGASAKELDDLADDTEAWTKVARTYTNVEHVEISLVKQEGTWLVRTIRF